MTKNYINYLVISLSLINAGCAPVAFVAGSALIGNKAGRDIGLSGSIQDSVIKAEISRKIMQYDTRIHSNLGLSIFDGKVLLTGMVPTEIDKQSILKSVWETRGVLQVIDEMKVGKFNPNIADLGKDSWITGRVKAAIMLDKDIKSVNYYIKTVDQVVYVLGTARSQHELQKVIDIAQSIKGVSRVANFVSIVGMGNPQQIRQTHHDFNSDENYHDSMPMPAPIEGPKHEIIAPQPMEMPMHTENSTPMSFDEVVKVIEEKPKKAPTPPKAKKKLEVKPLEHPLASSAPTSLPETPFSPEDDLQDLPIED